MNHHGIQLIYKHQVMFFTECKWAAFFDELGWHWEYQPHEMDYYLPDFLLRFAGQPHYVEVKGAATTVHRLTAESQKIFHSSRGFEGGKTLVGTDPSVFLGDHLPLPIDYRDAWQSAVGIADKIRREKYKTKPLLNKVTHIIGDFRPVMLQRSPIRNASSLDYVFTPRRTGI